MELNCQISIPEIPGLKANQLTVGQPFVLQCQGDATGFDFAQARLVLDEAQKHDFRLIKATSDKIQMVTYLTGDIQAGVIKLSDPVQELNLNIPAFKVTSVLPEPKKNEEGVAQPTEPFGYNILNIQWPLAYTVFSIFISCVVLVAVIMQIRKARRLRRLVRGLKDYESPLSPDHQFYKQIRQLEKKNYPVADVEKQFHIYVIRRYGVPLFGLSVSETTRFLKKTWPTWISERRDLKNILSDLKKMADQENPVETKIYLKKLYQFVDHSEEKFGGPS